MLLLLMLTLMSRVSERPLASLTLSSSTSSRVSVSSSLPRPSRVMVKLTVTETCRMAGGGEAERALEAEGL